MLKVKMMKLSSDELFQIKLMEDMIQSKLDEQDNSSPLHNYYLQLADCSLKIKDYSICE